MQRPTSSGGGAAPDLPRLCQRLVRAVRSRPQYREVTPGVMADMLGQLKKNFDRALTDGPFRIEVGNGALLVDGRPVVQERNPRDSVPGALYRDGVRAIEFSPGVTEEELDALVLAMAAGLQPTGVGDDVVSALWRHNLRHVKLEMAEPEDEGQAAAVESMLSTMFGQGNAEIGLPPTNVPGRMAEAVARTLEQLGDDAPGYHPPMVLKRAPAYGDELAASVLSENEEHTEFRLVNCALDAMCQRIGQRNVDRVSKGLLDAYWCDLRSDLFRRSARFVATVNQLLGVGTGAHLVEPWIAQAVQVQRLREVLVAALPALDAQHVKELVIYLKACGDAAMPAMMASYSGLTDPKSRRYLSQLALQTGFDDLTHLRPLLNDSNQDVVMEALFMLARIETPEAKKMLEGAKNHPRPELRIALLGSGAFDENETIRMAIAFLRDADPQVQIAGANRLAEAVGDRRAVSELRHLAESGAIDDAPGEVKDAFLTALAQSGKGAAVPVVEKLVMQAEGRRSSPGQLDLALSAVRCLRYAGTPEAVQLVKKIFTSKNPKLRDAAKDVAMRMRR